MYLTKCVIYDWLQICFWWFLDVPTIKDSPKETYTRTEYQDLFIPCTWNDASGLSKWTFSGKDGDKELTDKVQVSGLNLTSVTRDNEGNYTCSITNDFGEGSVTVVIAQVISKFIHINFFTWLLALTWVIMFLPAQPLKFHSNNCFIIQAGSTGTLDWKPSFCYFNNNCPLRN